MNFSNHPTVITDNNPIDHEVSKTNSDVFVKSQRKKYLINSNQVLFIKSESNYSTIYFMSSKLQKVFTSRTLKHWGIQFNSDQLIKVHNSYLINKSKIKAINRDSKTMLIEGGLEIPYSRGNRSLIKTFNVNN